MGYREGGVARKRVACRTIWPEPRFLGLSVWPKMLLATGISSLLMLLYADLLCSFLCSLQLCWSCFRMLAWRIFHPTRLGPPVAGEGGTACSSRLVCALQSLLTRCRYGRAQWLQAQRRVRMAFACCVASIVNHSHRLRGSPGITAICAAAANWLESGQEGK